MGLDFFLELLFPAKCAGCGANPEKGAVLCEQCAKSLESYDSLFCGKCLARLPNGKKICHPDHPFILGACLRYHIGAAKGLIKALKFGRNKKVAGYLASRLAAYLKKLPIELDRYEIVPIPLSPARLRDRGFNQAKLIAETLSPLINIPLLDNGLIRRKHSLPQSEIHGRKERFQNVSGAFLAKTEIVAGKNIILLDDVVTSGATMLEAARALKTGGAKKIIALAAAKAG